MKKRQIIHAYRNERTLRENVKIPYTRDYFIDGFTARRDRSAFASEEAMLRVINETKRIINS